MSRPRLTTREIAILRDLAVRSGLGGAVTLRDWQRGAATALWRRELIEIWYRQSPDGALQGPFFSLTIIGRALAAAFTTAHHGGLS